ncbi:hypothetical protein NDU88_006618 [Pleurodeles waltl]|uniref:Uncharacterized protein n=1 Tax=Pleurodeles waltl TaxID=8319 RepID=A0AAV7RSM3_PLEWA|nr:hypothetical protein NDU88_006618 [Pleurodeles waltl]
MRAAHPVARHADAPGRIPDLERDRSTYTLIIPASQPRSELTAHQLNDASFHTGTSGIAIKRMMNAGTCRPSMHWFLPLQY